MRRGMLGACAASFFHGLVTATLAVQQLWHWPIVVDAVNTPAENLTLQISTVGPFSEQHIPRLRLCAQHDRRGRQASFQLACTWRGALPAPSASLALSVGCGSGQC